MDTSRRVKMGDIILIGAHEQDVLKTAFCGQFVVEEAFDKGGWFVVARKLSDVDGKYYSHNPKVEFHQCPGYEHSLIVVNVVGQMKRVFV